MVVLVVSGLVLALAILGAALWIAQRAGRMAAERDFHGMSVRRATRALEIEEDVGARSSGDVDDGLQPFRRG